ncbi:hypothetical protein SLS62_009626 [Diatrype stigma]|uniref:Amidohydrolase-related domain-containing protein n=1 Tax=Diatrype stigma TaxID=117547 RepID=A0AAN9YKJ0_9PEZI
MASSKQQKGEKNKLFIGTFIHSKQLDELEFFHDTAVCVDKSGKIIAVESSCDQKRAEETLYPKLGWSAADVDVTVGRDGEFFFPGFIDTHIHAPQYPNAGLFGKSTLLDWLNTYTFPMEASLSDLARARRIYSRCVRRTLAHGTTTAVYFATIHVAATNLLADLCLGAGQRAFVGRVCMDHSLSGPPDANSYLDESAAASEAATRATIAHVRAIDPSFALVSPILTPRFAPACSREALRRLGALRAETGLPVQTHISENVGEVALVRACFPEAAHYADVYDRAGLLGARTVLAHAVYLSPAELDLVASRGAGVAHCPCSNSALTSGEAPVRVLLDRGISVGLGTDVSGGYSASVLEAARLAALVSRHVAMPRSRPRRGRIQQGEEKGEDGNEDEGEGEGGEEESEEDRERREKAKLSVEEVLYLATRGGAKVVGLADQIGAFRVGMDWDAQLVGLSTVGEEDVEETQGITKEREEEEEDRGNVDIFGWESWEERVAKWVYNGDDRNTRMVWVKGRLVHQRRK